MRQEEATKTAATDPPANQESHKPALVAALFAFMFGFDTFE
jgi:hypothetical protein